MDSARTVVPDKKKIPETASIKMDTRLNKEKIRVCPDIKNVIFKCLIFNVSYPKERFGLRS